MIKKQRNYPYASKMGASPQVGTRGSMLPVGATGIDR
jgi:hypothetical protein